MGDQYCISHERLIDEIKKVEDKADSRHYEAIERAGDTKAYITEIKSMVKSMHKRLDKFGESHESLAKTVVLHMNDEMEVHKEAAIQRAKTNELLEHVATKEDIAKTNGRVTTMWIIGAFTVSAIMSIIISIMLYFGKEIIEEKIVSSSKANYKGLKKVIKENRL